MDLWIALAHPPEHWLTVLLFIFGLTGVTFGLAFLLSGWDRSIGLTFLGASAVLFVIALEVVPALTQDRAAAASITAYLEDTHHLVRVGPASYDADARSFTTQVVTQDGTVRTATVTWMPTGDAPATTDDLPEAFEPVTVDLTAADTSE